MSPKSSSDPQTYVRESVSGKNRIGGKRPLAIGVGSAFLVIAVASFIEWPAATSAPPTDLFHQRILSQYNDFERRFEEHLARQEQIHKELRGGIDHMAELARENEELRGRLAVMGKAPFPNQNQEDKYLPSWATDHGGKVFHEEPGVVRIRLLKTYETAARVGLIVEIENLSSDPLRVDPDRFRLSGLVASGVLHEILAPAGAEGDAGALKGHPNKTVGYLILERTGHDPQP